MAIDFDALERPEREELEVEIVTFSGRQTKKVLEGTTVGDFKAANGLTGNTIVDEDSNILRDDDVIEEDMQVYISQPKKNG